MKNIVITGVSRGIGKATAEQLLNEGHRVIGWGRKSSITHDNYDFVKCDVRDEDEVKSAVEATLKSTNNRIDVLLNNAGLGIFGATHKFTTEDWKLMFDTNVHGLFFCTRAVLPTMKAQNAGHIINISSTAGQKGIVGAVGYCGTKHAVKGISHALQKETKRYGVKVTTIYPDAVNTNFFDDIEHVEANQSMMRAEDIALAISNAINTPPNLLPVDIELWPLNVNYNNE